MLSSTALLKIAVSPVGEVKLIDLSWNRQKLCASPGRSRDLEAERKPVAKSWIGADQAVICGDAGQRGWS